MGAVHFKFPEHRTLINAIGALNEVISTMKKGDTFYDEYNMALVDLKECEMSCRFFGFTDDIPCNCMP